ncbi:MAG: hypothetical protein Q7V57_04010 [Actinomycetota bacterium]|nr:hypothetical protein [Actinomycetota bacterium]
MSSRLLFLFGSGLCGALLLGCSDASDSAAGPTTTVAEASAPAPPTFAVPIVGEIDAAVTALEAELGGPQAYFEINATAKLVNLFVSLNDGAIVQPWLYLDGELSSQEGRPAAGGTFVAADLTFDASLVLSKLQTELPGATIESFYVNGDGDGNVQYGALLTSAQGGGLDVLLGPAGEVLSVDPVN